jgi:hypothetical protein
MRPFSSEALGGFDQHCLGGFGLLRADDHRAAGLDDARFLGGDEFDAVAEIGLVVERHRHDQRDSRVGDDVGRIETAAQPHLDDRRVGRLLGKQDEGDGGEDFEDGDRLAAIGLRHPRDGFRQQRIIDELAAALGAQPVAFVPVDQMRRGVDVHPVACGFQQRSREGGGRALAVGAGDVDDRRQVELRIAEPVEQPCDAIERKVVAFRVQRHQALDFAVCEQRCHRKSQGREPAGGSRIVPAGRCTQLNDAARDVAQAASE